MKFDYNKLLIEQLYALKNELSIADFDFEVDSEQAFLKRKTLEPNTIYVLTRDLQNENQIGVDTQPVQILILTEQNSLDVAKTFFSEFAKKYNWQANLQEYTEDGETHNIWVKQQYSDPVVLSNFNTVSYGYRSVMYISANLYIMYDVVDLRYLAIDDEEYQVMSFDLAYNMNPNTQQLSGTGNFISKSVKSVSTMSLVITIPVVSSNLITKVFSIMNESDSTPTDQSDPTSYGGNENFYFDFTLGSTEFTHKAFKLTNAEFGASVNNVPAIRLGFTK